MKLALGTAQFGLDYGIANRSGQVPESEIAAILRTARDVGIVMLDTAIAYGSSEARLGAAGISGFDVVSKLPQLGGDAAGIGTAVQGTLTRLRIPQLYGLLLHRSQDLSGPRGEAVFAALCDLKSRGLVKKIGISIYETSELDEFVSRFSLDLIQAPYNVFDRRLETSGWLDRLKNAGIEVHTRSTFLQGLLLMQGEDRPPMFAGWAEQWSRWDGWLNETGLSPLAAALGFVCRNPDIDKVLVGVDTQAQLSDIIRVSMLSAESPPERLATDDLSLINPANWKSLSS